MYAWKTMTQSILQYYCIIVLYCLKGNQLNDEDIKTTKILGVIHFKQCRVLDLRCDMNI